MTLSLFQGDILLAEEANKKSTEEIKKLQEEMSALRQENIQLRVRFFSHSSKCCFNSIYAGVSCFEANLNKS